MTSWKLRLDGYRDDLFWALNHRHVGLFPACNYFFHQPILVTRLCLHQPNCLFACPSRCYLAPSQPQSSLVARLLPG